jgi:O-antigen/teichoic acid export membrane protein
MLSGNVVYALCQWVCIVALAKLGSSFIVGQFSLGLAIATPILMFTNLHLRAVQATDAQRLYSFREYLRLRILLTSLGLVVIAGIAWFGGYARQTALVVLLVAAAKAIETVSDIHYGLFQLNDRLDETGKSMMLRGVFASIAMGAALYFTRSVLWGCAGMAFVWVAVLLLFDMRRGRRLLPSYAMGRSAGPRRRLNLMCTALPLGLATTMAALNLNMPRYFIHTRLGERQLGIYSALAYSSVAMVLVSDSLGHSAIPRLSRLYCAQQAGEYRALLGKLVAAGAALGLTGLIVARCFGERLLTVVYGREYAAHYRVFLLLIVATAIYCAACMFTSAITAARCFRIQAPLYALVVGANALACGHLVPAAGLTGAAQAMVLASTVHLALGISVVAVLLKLRPKGQLSC